MNAFQNHQDFFFAMLFLQTVPETSEKVEWQRSGLLHLAAAQCLSDCQEMAKTLVPLLGEKFSCISDRQNCKTVNI